ncbi:MAG: MarC family protein, partial [Rhodospirillales bacterium]
GAHKKDISVFPLATPLIAVPGTMGAVVLLTAEQADLLIEAAVIAALLIVLAITLACLLAATKIQKVLGVTGLNVVSRVIGVLLAALAVQFIFDGIRTSGLIPGVS